ncbi:MAG: NADH-quinone oxidoreductase subunit L, partial [Flavobacteriales bacterium]
MGKDMLLLTLISLPLIGAAINGMLGKKLPKLVVGSLATIMVFVSFLLGLTLFSGIDKTQIVHLFQVAKFDDFTLDANFQIDSLSIWMTLIITGIGSLIHLFSM